MEIKKDHIKKYLEESFGGKLSKFKIAMLGEGCLGTGYLVEFEVGGKSYRKIFKSLFTENMGKDYAGDRAQSLILAHHTYGSMENHIKSIDVVGVGNNGKIVSVGIR